MTGWSQKFDDPIDLPNGRQLMTLMDAGDYITELPKAEHSLAEWQAAMEALMLVATTGGPTMFARIAAAEYRCASRDLRVGPGSRVSGRCVALW